MTGPDRGQSCLFYGDGDYYIPCEPALGPWNPDALHGGSTAGLLAAVLEERQRRTGLRLARLTVDLLRPVPASPLRAEFTPLKTGRRLAVAEVCLFAGDDTVARGTGLYLAQNAVPVTPGQFDDITPLPWNDEAPAAPLLDVVERNGSAMPLTLPGLHRTVLTRLVDGMEGQGRGRAWLHLPVPVIAGTANSPTVQAAALSDFGNAVGQLRPDDNTGTINTDITLHLHRAPRGEWLGLASRSRLEDNGSGLVEAVLYDRDGAVGRISQAVLTMLRFEARADTRR